MQTAVGTGEALGSSPTLCRMERRAHRADVIALNRVLVEQMQQGVCIEKISYAHELPSGRT